MLLVRQSDGKRVMTKWRLWVDLDAKGGSIQGSELI